MSKPHHFAPQCVRTFESWAASMGLFLDLTHLPTLQLGLGPWESLNMIGLSCKAWSQLRRLLPMSVNEHVTVGDIPLHYSALFVNEHGYSYFSNRLVQEGLVVLSDLLQSPWKLGLLPPSFHSSFSSHTQTLATAPADPSPIQWASVILQNSPKSFFPVILVAQEVTGRQPVQVWRSFDKLVLPHSSKEFIREGPWAKLKVWDRLKAWLPGKRNCALCGDIETVSHALFNCKLLLLACDTISKCFDTISKCLDTPVHSIAQDHEKTLTTPQGLLLWSARQASWNVRTSVRLSHKLVNGSHFVGVWHCILQTRAELPASLNMQSELGNFYSPYKRREEKPYGQTVRQTNHRWGAHGSGNIECTFLRGQK